MINDYRYEIDGIRAIAVISVIFFHFNISIFKGGFVGVDIFFVISGFLITKVIQSQINENRFSLKLFYLNRAKRLLPALYFLLITLILIGYFTFDFLTFKSAGKQIIACLFYFSNILFWKEIGYFDNDSIQKPLLHTWSLSIEEQFYLLFPILLIVLNKHFRTRIVTILFILFLVSFAANIYLIQVFKSATFFLLPTRAWELLSGSLLFFAPQSRVSNRIKNFLFSIGLFGIFYSISNITSDDFPGFKALFPVAGTILVIYYSNNSDFYFVKMLKSSLSIFVGKISYSLYLWHWLVLVLYKYILMRDFVYYDLFYCFIITVCLSFLSWKYIEQNFRYYDSNKNNKVFLSILSISLFFFTIAFLINRRNGIPNRSQLNENLIEIFNDSFWDKITANEAIIAKQQTKSPLHIGVNTRKADFILWGDSHARALSYGLDIFGKKNKLGGYICSYSATPPITEIDNLNNSSFNIEKYNQSVLDFIIRNDSIKNIILCARWTYYIKDTFDQNEFNNRPIFFNSNISKIGKTMKNKDLFFYGLSKTITKLLKAKKNIFIVTPLPELNFDVKNYVGNYRLYHFFKKKMPKNIKDEKIYYKENHYFFEYFSKLANHPNIHLLNIQEVLYKNQSDVYESGNLIYRDKNHLSKFGSLFVSQMYISIFK